MEVVRDELWERCLTDAAKMYRVGEPNEKCYKLANATWIMKMRYMEEAKKKQERTLIVIDKPREMAAPQRTAKKLCCATTMSGKPCSFKAVCGDYCKKHNVKQTQLGVMVDVTKIKISD